MSNFCRIFVILKVIYLKLWIKEKRIKYYEDDSSLQMNLLRIYQIIIGITIVGISYVKYNYDFFLKEERSSFFSSKTTTQDSEKVMQFTELKVKLFDFIKSNSSKEIKEEYHKEWLRLLEDAGIYSSMSLMKDLNLTHVPYGELPEIYYEMKEKVSEIIPQAKTCHGEHFLFKNKEEISDKYKEFELHEISEFMINFHNHVKEFKKRRLRGMINSIDEKLISEKEKKTLIEIRESIIESKECFFEHEYDEENLEFNLKIIENSEIYSKIIRVYEKIFKTEVQVREFPRIEL